MTTNRELTATWTYHNGTKHSWESIRSDPHSLDWKNYPLAFKMYATLDPVPLPHEWPPVSMPTLSAIAGTSLEPNDECIPDLLTLAKLLFLSAGITKRRTHAGGEMYFRAAACTRATYWSLKPRSCASSTNNNRRSWGRAGNKGKWVIIPQRAMRRPSLNP